MSEANLENPGSLENKVIATTDLPSVPDEEFELLDPRYLWLRWMGNGFFAIVIIVVASVVTIVARDVVTPWLPAAIASGLLLLTALSAWLQWLEIEHLGYLVRTHDLSYRSGVLSRSVITVPFARVQNVTIERGPLERWQGLASLEVKTAAGELFGGLTIRGLDHDTAQRLRVMVADRAAVLADAEEQSEVQLEDQPVAPPQSHPPDRPQSEPPLSQPFEQ